MRLLKRLISFLNNDFFVTFPLIAYPYRLFSSLSIGVIFLYLYSFFVNNWDIVVYRHDNLDSNIVLYKLLADTGTFFSTNSTVIPNIMNGVPRVVLPSEFNVVSLLYYLFEPIYAYIINEMLIRLIAFWGMLLLLKQYFLKKETKTNNKIGSAIIVTGTALVFALLPYWSNGGASIAGQPFVLYAFLNIKNRDLSYKNWLILMVFTFYSSLILAGMFFLTMLMFIFIYDWIKSRTLNIYMFLSLLLMSVLYLLIEYRLIINLLDPILISHRQEFVSEYLNFDQSLYKSLRLFFKGQYHAHSIHGTYILPFILISIFFTFFYNYTNKLHNKYFLTSTPFLIILSIVVISLFGGFEDFILFQSIKENYPILKQVQFDRFYFLFALLWFLLFAIFAKSILEKTKWGIFLAIFVLSLQVFYSFSIQSSEMMRDPQKFKRFYSEKVFRDIKKYINLPIDSYRIMNIGLYPSIAIYNGFYTLDAYMATYPLKYKHEFRKIIFPELEKSKKWRKYFDNWGSRCRLMNMDKNITLNLKQFKMMGGKYIFSSYKVNINNGENIKFLKKFSNKDSLYDVYLYQVK